jgi:hypothetical protein
MAGRAWVYLGSPDGVVETPAVVLEGEGTQAYFGSSVAGAGDVDGDGLADVVVGAGYLSGGGPSYVYCGSATGVDVAPCGTPLMRTAAWSVAGAGDLDGDGYDDVAVGAPRDGYGVGEVHVYPGSAAGVTEGPVLEVDGDDWLGRWLAGAGDVNGDGHPGGPSRTCPRRG